MPARTDNVTSPELAAGLLLARRGQAFFSRKLNELRDADFDAPSLVPGWSRRHVAVHVGLNARAICRLVSWAATGVEQPMYASSGQRVEEIELGATLPVRAIRHLSDHAAVHLNVEWRDLPEAAWSNEVVTAQGRTVPVSETVWMRTREVWVHALDLDNGADTEQYPDEIVDRLLSDLVAVWTRKRAGSSAPVVVLEPDDRTQVLGDVAEGGDTREVRGRAADLVRWGTGRGSSGARTASGDPAPAAPPWL